MKRDKERRAKSAIRIQKKYGLSDPEMDQLCVASTEKLANEYREKVKKRYGKDIYDKAEKWYVGLSDREKKNCWG